MQLAAQGQQQKMESECERQDGATGSDAADRGPQDGSWMHPGRTPDVLHSTWSGDGAAMDPVRHYWLRRPSGRQAAGTWPAPCAFPRRSSGDTRRTGEEASHREYESDRNALYSTCTLRRPRYAVGAMTQAQACCSHVSRECSARRCTQAAGRPIKGGPFTATTRRTAAHDAPRTAVMTSCYRSFGRARAPPSPSAHARCTLLALSSVASGVALPRCCALSAGARPRHNPIQRHMHMLPYH